MEPERQECLIYIMRKLIIWALFDSGNGCYTQVARQFSNIEIYPIGIDIERRNRHFIHLNLADYGRLFGDNTLYNTLDKLPPPDLIIASPPCESFSVASSIKHGNPCWKQEHKNGSRFVIRTRSELNDRYINKRGYVYNTSFINRINGELCIFNTIEIIKRYKPKVYIIENPYSSRIWDYIDKVIGFKIPHDNPTYYGNYGWICKKPTKFKSNIELRLRFENYYSGVKMNNVLRSYNDRSAIPLELVRDIYRAVGRYLEMDIISAAI